MSCLEENVFLVKTTGNVEIFLKDGGQCWLDLESQSSDVNNVYVYMYNVGLRLNTFLLVHITFKLSQVLWPFFFLVFL